MLHRRSSFSSLRATGRARGFDPTNESILDAADGAVALDIGGKVVTHSVNVAVQVKWKTAR